jgi:signal transduction histidine kinase/ligand-binding sensor domain-containing protein
MRLITLLLFIVFHLSVFGQHFNFAHSITTFDGLPSNHIYDLCEDKTGFLWIATDNGIARFDGKKIQKYSTKNGLPSNDVLQIVKEKNGTIWALCYNQLPCYFDPSLNYFKPIKIKKEGRKFSNYLMQPYILKNGGIVFKTIIGSLEIQNKKNIKIINNRSKIYNLFIENDFFVETIKKNKTDLFLEFKKNNLIIGKIKISEPVISFKENNNYIYCFLKSNFLRVKINKSHPISIVKKKYSVQKSIRWYKFFDNELHVYTKDGAIIIYELKDLKVKKIILPLKELNTALIDKNHNLWVGTNENGLNYYTASSNKSYTVPGISNNFLSILYQKGTIYAGNYNGQIITLKNQTITTHTIQSESKNDWIRYIQMTGGKIIALTDNGYSINYNKIKPIIKNNFSVSLKSTCLLNDSILILGSNDGLFQLNVNTEKYLFVNQLNTKILQIVKKDNHSFYALTNDGVFLYNFEKNVLKNVYLNEELTDNKISQIATTKNGDLWISTFKGSLALIRNKRVILNFNNSENLPENITKISDNKKRLWITSKTGLYVLNYTNLKHLSIHKLSKFDGLLSNELNTATIKNDTVYIATTKGISVIPTSVKFKKYEINPTIVAIRINNKLQPFKNKFDLDKDSKSVSIYLSGVELSGHFNKFQYSINNNKNWIDLDENMLNLILKGGENNIEIRAKDVNNNLSTRKIKLQFNVDLPYYSKIWFWSLLVIVTSSLIIWLIVRGKLKKERKEFEKKLALENQRSIITADLHDEIGSTLSSLQINSAIANLSFDKDPNQTKKILTKIELQAELLAERVGDIIWSIKPGNEEFLALSSRIKNFTNDILGETKIKYSFQIDQSIDTLLSKVSIRKNLLLFMKEAINNTAKYSQAKHLKISLSIVNQKIKVEISDDGIGFDTSITKGNGIGNMKNRVAELKGELRIVSAPFEGTKIIATIPCNIN